MNVQDLIDKLNRIEDKTLEVVVREGPNHGGNIVRRASTWLAYDNPNHTNCLHPCDVLLPDSQYKSDKRRTVLVLD
jgi:hypothetical protein